MGGTALITHHTGPAHTDSDVMIEVVQQKLLFAGDIIEYGRAVSSDVPQDFDARGRLKRFSMRCHYRLTALSLGTVSAADFQ